MGEAETNVNGEFPALERLWPVDPFLRCHKHRHREKVKKT